MASSKCKALKYFIKDEGKANVDYGKLAKMLGKADARKVLNIKRQEAKHGKTLREIYRKTC